MEKVKSFLNILQEVDEPWQLDMSELCLNDEFPRNIQGNCPGKDYQWPCP